MIKFNDAPFVPCNDCANWESCQEDAYNQGRTDVFDEIIEWLKTNPKYVTYISCEYLDEVNSKIGEYYEYIVQQLNELKERK